MKSPDPLRKVAYLMPMPILDRLKDESRRSGYTQSDIIRAALIQYFETRSA